MRCRNGSDVNPTSAFFMAIGPSQARLTLRSAVGRISTTSRSTSIPTSSRPSSFLLGEWYIQQYLASRYSGVTGADFIAFSIFMTMHPEFQGPKYRLFRALMFVATGLSDIAPLIHGLNMFGMSQMMRRAFPYSLAKTGCLLSGTSFYKVSLPISHTREKLTLTHVVLKTRFPESRYPGKFDLWGSHSIFHILVVCAAVVQLMGYLDAFDYAHANLTCLSL